MKSEEGLLIQREYVLYGLLKAVNKDSISIWLHTGEKLTVLITEGQRKELSHRVGKDIGLSGTAVLNLSTYKVNSFVLKSITPYEGGKVSEGFAKLRELSSGFWDGLTDEQIKDLLHGD